MVRKKEKIANFIILKTSIQAFIKDKIIRFNLIDKPELHDVTDLMMFDVAFTTSVGKRGMIQRIAVRNFVLYKLYYDGTPIHTFTDEEYDIMRPYYASNINDYLDRLAELARNYNKWRRSPNVRKPFLYHVRTGMKHYQELFHNGGIERCGTFTRTQVCDFTDESLFEYPELVLCKQDGKHLIKFSYVMN